MTVAERLQRVRAAIPPGVTLVAVSKGQPAAAIREAHAAGQRHFGENYVQEWREKAEALADLPGLSWHFVGSLQTNKAKYLVGRVALVHTVDRLELAREVSRRSAQKGAVTAVLLEVNVAGEASKTGCTPAEVPALAGAVRALSGLDLRGLMCIPPAEGDPRPHFRALRALRDRLELTELSMGMSGDYPAAVEEGATLVRVGTAIFGERPAPAARP
ncbi:MAG TPA: YggS family pyridoxal phosphate-dependent enzyme [Anaeromyxobacteraceae bacterium]|nr:YggS family pyridoxal phosphate-dependent enzyme [Anaeromyxobacteraceae bacterium]